MHTNYRNLPRLCRYCGRIWSCPKRKSPIPSDVKPRSVPRCLLEVAQNVDDEPYAARMHAAAERLNIGLSIFPTQILSILGRV